MTLPIFLSKIQDVMLLQTKWSSVLNPVISNPSIQSVILKNITLANGTTVVNHMLGRNLTGWRIIRQRAQAGICDVQDSNQTPQLTLVLLSDADVSVDLECF